MPQKLVYTVVAHTNNLFSREVSATLQIKPRQAAKSANGPRR
jgi:hypothetical protein